MQLILSVVTAGFLPPLGSLFNLDFMYSMLCIFYSYWFAEPQSFHHYLEMCTCSLKTKRPKSLLTCQDPSRIAIQHFRPSRVQMSAKHLLHLSVCLSLVSLAASVSKLTPTSFPGLRRDCRFTTFHNMKPSGCC